MPQAPGLKLPVAPEGKSGWPWGGADESAPAPSAPPGGWPLISVVIPSFNMAGYLEETLRSVLLQNYPRLELLVVDGGSTDDSAGVIKKYEQHVSWWVSERDSGQANAINKGFRRATGTLRAWLNASDFYLPNALFTAAAMFAARPGLQLLCGQRRYIHADGHTSPCPGQWYRHPRLAMLGSWSPPQECCFWTSASHQAAGELREDLPYAFDYDWFLRLAGNGPVLCDSHELAAFRLHENQKSAQSTTAKETPAFSLDTTQFRERWRILDDHWRTMSFIKRVPLRVAAHVYRRAAEGSVLNVLRPPRMQTLLAVLGVRSMEDSSAKSGSTPTPP